MFPTTLLTVALAALTSVQAIRVTAPSTSTVQAAGTALQLSWDSVSTDPTSFAVVLVNQNAAFLANSPVTLVANQTTSAGSTSLSYPSGAWPTGTGFQVNLVRSTNDINSILAQSDMFNITGSGSSSSASSSAASSSSVSSSSVSSAASSTGSHSSATPVQSGASAVYSGNAQTTAAIPSGSSTSGAGRVVVSGLLAMGLVGGAASFVGF